MQEYAAYGMLTCMNKDEGMKKEWIKGEANESRKDMQAREERGALDPNKVDAKTKAYENESM